MGANPLRILIVDDHGDTVSAFQRLLRRDGHQAIGSQSFDEALALAKNERFDLLICDIGLPQHDGYDLFAQLKNLYPIRAIAVTGYGMPEDRKRIEAAGFNDFLLKPVELHALKAAIENQATEIEAEREQKPPTGPSPFNM